jgi:hypothetical protein
MSVIKKGFAMDQTTLRYSSPKTKYQHAVFKSETFLLNSDKFQFQYHALQLQFEFPLLENFQIPPS